MKPAATSSVDFELPGPGAASGVAWLITLAVFTLAYMVTALGGLALAIPPSQTSPLFPAAGIALAGVLVYGWRMLFGIGLGAAAITAGVLLRTGTAHGASLVVLPLVMAGAAGLQAALGATLVRRYAGDPITLTRPGQVGRFVAACAASCLITATLGTLTLAAFGMVPAGGLLTAWATWSAGTLAGLLIVTPIALTLIGRPRADWAPRRGPVGLTMTLVVALLALGISQVARWNGERLRAAFEHDASNATLTLATQLQEPLRALDALHGVLSVARHLSRDEMHTATESWLSNSAIRTMGWTERVRRDEIAGFEARVRAEGTPEFHVFDRPDAANASETTPPVIAFPVDGRDAFVVRHLEPETMRSAVLGRNSLSAPHTRAAIVAAVESAEPAATAAYVPHYQLPGENQKAIVLYRALYDGPATTPADRRAAVRGLAFVTLAVDAQLASVADKLPRYLKLCVVDVVATVAAGSGQRLAGPAGCEAAITPFAFTRPMTFGGRRWELRAAAAERDLPDAFDRSGWIFSAVGLLSAAMLGASLLITTGRTRRIESAVLERTAALRAEVSERQSVEQALRASERRFRNILDHVPIGVVYSDLAGRVIQANPRFCELTGHTEAELAELPASSLSHADDVAGTAALSAQLVAGEIATYRNQHRLVTRSGTTVSVRSTVSLLRDANNEPWRIVAVVEDITEHLRLEEAESAREAAEAANLAKSEFLSRMSHELRTPLNAMLGFAQLLEIDRRHPLDDAQRPWVAQIQQAGWHLLEMINDVLDLSRIESDNLRLQSTPLDLREIVRATTALVAGDAERRNIRITEQLSPGTSAVMGDSTRVKQILTNLLSNAVKYNVDGGRIHIAARLAGADQIEVSVTDTGLGMTPEQMDLLFRPFNRLGRERTALPGTGIGLVISRRLAELMGGTIRVKSMPGEGSSFILRLSRAVDADTVRSALDAFDAVPTDYHRRRVHYVEDNETNVEVMRGILAQRAQVQLEVSVTGLDGLAAMRAQRPHLVLLDMHLPDISGLELLRHLKADPATASIPVIAVSADATSQQIDAALDAGAVRYLTKPVDVTELLAAVDDLLDRMDTGFS